MAPQMTARPIVIVIVVVVVIEVVVVVVVVLIVIKLVQVHVDGICGDDVQIVVVVDVIDIVVDVVVGLLLRVEQLEFVAPDCNPFERVYYHDPADGNYRSQQEAEK